MRKMKLLTCLLACAMALCLLPAVSLAEVLELPIDTSAGLPFQGEYKSDVMVYEDPSIRVEWNKVENGDTHFNCIYYYARIKIANATQLRTAAVNGFDRGNRAKAQVMAKRTNAVLAINGDFYGARSESYVLRQGVVYRDKVGPNQDILLIDEAGDFHVLLAADNPAEIDKTTINGKKVINAFSFGPALIVDNQTVLVESSSPVMSAPESRCQRMCIVQTGPLEYMAICVRMVGCTAQEMVELVYELCDNVEVAYLLDGGESSQMVFMGALINKPTRSAREVTDIVYFASAYQPEE
ncbi:MAG: phosphodiester glycosidase family protein [Clostridiales bacterium]|nr:phosphodiester glycosidase family protein [Clostridiales bacterium]